MSRFPFTAIVGLELAKKSLIYHALDPRLGGTLLLGHRGCAKSTLVRAFAGLLYAKEGNFCEVPLGVSEDRLLGSVDPESLVEKKEWKLRPGLLEKANGGILYVDEINLLPDHLSDLILDSAASGVHHLERDGITRMVESRYILVGTMNPEEGELRPQLLDRFAHGVRIHDHFSEEERMDIIQRRLAFDDDPAAFEKVYEKEEAQLWERIHEARGRLKGVVIRDEQRREIARRGHELKVEGMRTELAVMRTARSAAAWHSRPEVSTGDIEEAWTLCLGHRRNEVEPPSPRTPPQASGPASAPGSTERGKPAAQSVSPLRARDHDVQLRVERTNESPDFSAWWNSPKRLDLQKPGHGYDPTTTAQTPILWLASVLASVRDGWLSGHGELRVCRSRKTSRRSLWIFLDASRSTGMTGFLAKTLSFLQTAREMKIDARVHVLLLHKNRVRWLCRHARWVTAVTALGSIQTASGGSHLADALVGFTRSMLRKRYTHPWAVIFTDGLNRRSAEDTVAQSKTRMRLALRRVQAVASTLAWSYPKQRPGAPNLSERLFAEFPGTRWQL